MPYSIDACPTVAELLAGRCPSTEEVRLKNNLHDIKRSGTQKVGLRLAVNVLLITLLHNYIETNVQCCLKLQVKTCESVKKKKP